MLFFLLHLQHFPPTLFSHKRGGRQADTYRVVLFLFIYYFGCRRCLPRGSLQLLSCAGGRRGWLLSAVLGARRLIGNTMRDSAQKRHSTDRQISQSHLGTSRGARDAPCRGAPRSLVCSIISRCFPAHPHMCCSVCMICPKRRSGSAGPRTAGATEPFPTDGASLDEQCRASLQLPNPKTCKGTSAQDRNSPPLPANSTLTRLVMIIILHLLSQNRTAMMIQTATTAHTARSKYSMSSADKVYGRQCLPWCAVKG